MSFGNLLHIDLPELDIKQTWEAARCKDNMVQWLRNSILIHYFFAFQQISFLKEFSDYVKVVLVAEKTINFSKIGVAKSHSNF